MQIFISWSGHQSKAVAQALHDWIPDVLQDTRMWMSEEDVAAGARWAAELGEQLKKSDYGILCLTQSNLEASWLLFEAGALSKMVETAHVVPYLYGIDSADVRPPLAQFQGVDATFEGTEKLIKGINGARAKPMPSEKLSRTFAMWWPELEKRLNQIPSENSLQVKRTDRDVLEEILSQVRTLGKSYSDLAALLKPPNPVKTSRRVGSGSWFEVTGLIAGRDGWLSCRTCNYGCSFEPALGDKPAPECPKCGAS